MPQPASGQLPATPSKPLGTIGRFIRLGLIGLAIVPFILGNQLGLVASTKSISVEASADAQVLARFPDRNYGDGIRLRSQLKVHGNQRTLVRFTLPTFTGGVKSVQLRLLVRDRSDNGGSVRQVMGTWSEKSVTWLKAPPLAPKPIGRIGSTGRAGTWLNVPLRLSGLKSGQKVDLAIVGASANGALYASRETGNGPKLVLALADPSASTPTPTGISKPRSKPTSAPTKAPTSGATNAPPAGVRTPAVGILIGRAELAALPTSGAAWNNLKSYADAAAGTPDIQNQDEDNDIHVLAKGLVYARTGIASYRSGVLSNLKAAVGTESGGRTLALGRNLSGYVIAADLIDLNNYDPAFDTGVFRPWLRKLLTENLDGRTLQSTHEDRPNNWGTHAGASRAAVARYLGDSAELARTAQVFKGYLGDRTSYAGFSYGDLAWQCDPANPVGVNPKGCVKNGVVIDGVTPDDLRRGGGFQWPPAPTGYAWEGMQGVLLQALILDRAGYDPFAWEDKAIARAAAFLFDRAKWVPGGDDTWQTWVINHVYGTSYPTSAARAGKNTGFTDWLFPR